MSSHLRQLNAFIVRVTTVCVCHINAWNLSEWVSEWLSEHTAQNKWAHTQPTNQPTQTLLYAEVFLCEFCRNSHLVNGTVGGWRRSYTQIVDKQMREEERELCIQLTSNHVIFIYKKIAVRKLNKYCGDETEKRDSKRQKIKLKSNNVGTRNHICSQFTYAAIVPHTNTCRCMHASMHVCDLKEKQTQNRRKHAILSDVLHKSLLSKRWFDRSWILACSVHLHTSNILNILEFALCYSFLYI